MCVRLSFSEEQPKKDAYSLLSPCPVCVFLCVGHSENEMDTENEKPTADIPPLYTHTRTGKAREREKEGARQRTSERKGSTHQLSDMNSA